MTAIAAPTWAVIPTMGRELLHDCLASLRGQVDGIVLVTNNGYTAADVTDVTVVRDPGQDRNISRWWNLGLDAVERLATARGASQWNTLIVNDDIVAPPNLAETLSARMRATSAVLSYPDQFDGTKEILHTDARGVDLYKRITGYAYMLRGETGLRVDESMVWWYSDDDIFRRACEAGGSLLVPGVAVIHHRPNGSMLDHPELNAQAGLDRGAFIEKWGGPPW